jgi:hypothetical protein
VFEKFQFLVLLLFEEELQSYLNSGIKDKLRQLRGGGGGGGDRRQLICGLCQCGSLS